MSLDVSDHKNSKRVRSINLKEGDLDRLVFPFKKHSITSLEYKPFSGFSLAKSLDEVFQNKLSNTLNIIIKLGKKIKTDQTIDDGKTDTTKEKFGVLSLYMMAANKNEKIVVAM